MACNLRTIKDIRNFLRSELAGIYPEEEAGSITRIIIYTVLGIEKLHFLAENDQQVSPENTRLITDICKKLKKGEPLQYILGETVFFDCRIKVNLHTLIPRPETEELVDLIIRENAGFTGRIIDIGTGSGCIAIALAVNLPGADIAAFDISEEALATARENAGLNNVRIGFFKADVFDMGSINTGKTDIIVSNPPYVTISEKGGIGNNVLRFEPHNALFVPDGKPLLYYQAILDLAEIILDTGGKIYFEINEAEGSAMKNLLYSYGYSAVRIFNDINGKERIIRGEKHA